MQRRIVLSPVRGGLYGIGEEQVTLPISELEKLKANAKAYTQVREELGHLKIDSEYTGTLKRVQHEREMNVLKCENAELLIKNALLVDELRSTQQRLKTLSTSSSSKNGSGSSSGTLEDSETLSYRLSAMKLEKDIAVQQRDRSLAELRGLMLAFSEKEAEERKLQAANDELVKKMASLEQTIQRQTTELQKKESAASSSQTLLKGEVDKLTAKLADAEKALKARDEDVKSLQLKLDQAHEARIQLKNKFKDARGVLDSQIEEMIQVSDATVAKMKKEQEEELARVRMEYEVLLKQRSIDGADKVARAAREAAEKTAAAAEKATVAALRVAKETAEAKAKEVMEKVLREAERKAGKERDTMEKEKEALEKERIRAEKQVEKDRQKVEKERERLEKEREKAERERERLEKERERADRKMALISVQAAAAEASAKEALAVATKARQSGSRKTKTAVAGAVHEAESALDDIDAVLAASSVKRNAGDKASKPATAAADAAFAAGGTIDNLDSAAPEVEGHDYGFENVSVVRQQQDSAKGQVAGMTKAKKVKLVKKALPDDESPSSSSSSSASASSIQSDVKLGKEGENVDDDDDDDGGVKSLSAMAAKLMVNPSSGPQKRVIAAAPEFASSFLTAIIPPQSTSTSSEDNGFTTTTNAFDQPATAGAGGMENAFLSPIIPVNKRKLARARNESGELFVSPPPKFNVPVLKTNASVTGAVPKPPALKTSSTSMSTSSAEVLRGVKPLPPASTTHNFVFSSTGSASTSTSSSAPTSAPILTQTDNISRPVPASKPPSAMIADIISALNPPSSSSSTSSSTSSSAMGVPKPVNVSSVGSGASHPIATAPIIGGFQRPKMMIPKLKKDIRLL